jgi:peptide/nickel transport system ATP-binding protein
MTQPILEIRDLTVQFAGKAGIAKAVAGVSFDLPRGKTLCIVGESGSGKSVTARAIMQLVPRPGRIVGGQILYHHDGGGVTDIARMAPSSRAMRAIRGTEMGMVFQETMTSLSPLHTIGEQISEGMIANLQLTKKEARARAIHLMDRVGIPGATRRYDAYPFQLSGGLRQRTMIAVALACEPRLLIADEPTTALDVTTQANIIELLADLQREMGMSVVFITHDLGVVAEIADEVVVMYMGTVAEKGEVDDIFHDPKHPYTTALLRSMPRLAADKSQPLASIRGTVPHPLLRPGGCVFHTRCDVAVPRVCSRHDPGLVEVGEGHLVRCVHYEDEAIVARGSAG